MLNLKSLREQIYDYLKDEMQTGNLAPGASIDMNEISRKLGISKTPLRDALIQLETEGFVTILPRRGILVKKLSLRDIKESYEIIGALEAAVVTAVFDQLREERHLAEMIMLNARQTEAIHKDDFETYYKLNLEFHGVFLTLSNNEVLNKIITPLKLRLYDFPRRTYLKEWEFQHLREHDAFIGCLKSGDRAAASNLIQNRHWSFGVHEKYFRQFYQLNGDNKK